MTKPMGSYAKTIMELKYAHERDGVKESWEEIAKRVSRKVMRAVNAPSSLVKEIEQAIIDRKFMPGGRYLRSTGKPFHQTQNCFDGATKIVTKTGVKTLKSCVDEDIEVRNVIGEWESATVKCFGEQEIVDLYLSNGLKIRTTEGHLWIQPDGSRVTTENLSEVMLSKYQEVSIDEEGIRHGIMFGDGHLVKGRYSQLYLCGDKKQELHKWFENTPVAVTVGCGAIRYYDPVRDVKTGKVVSLQPAKYKELPGDDTSPEYARGFIAGLIATDGCVPFGGSVQIHCEGLERAAKISELAVLGGCVVNSVRVVSRVSPFDGSDRELACISIKPFSAPVIRTDHKERLAKRRLRTNFSTTVEVEEIKYTQSKEPVYCVVAPTTHTFTLACGVITSNCLLLRAEDSREGWADLLHKSAMALMTGAGIGVVYSDIRPEGKVVRRTGGYATGPLALMQMVNEAGRGIIQGGDRRSAIWAGLHWNHADVHKFITLKNWIPEVRELKERDYNFPATMDGTNVSVILDDDFFAAYENEKHPLHAHAHGVYRATVRQMLKTAEPGFSIDTGANKGENLRNAPVSAKTHVLTREGYFAVEEILGRQVEVWTGMQWARTEFKCTNPKAPIVRVRLSHGRDIECDPGHPFLIERYDENDEFCGVSRVPAEELKPNDIAVTDPSLGMSVFVLSVRNTGKSEPVYCCDVKVPEHSFTAEGVVISNCTEITSRDDSDICNLGSINLANVTSVEEMSRLVEICTAFLLAGTVYSDVPYAKVDQVRSKNRRLGLGLMGLHEWLLQHGKSYGPDAELQKYLEAYAQSDQHAKHYAKEWDLSVPVKTRAIAPTGTIGIVAETTTGIEPIFCVAYKRRYIKGKLVNYQYVIDPTAQRLIEKGVDPDQIEDAYTLAENVERRVAFQAWVQQYVDHAISSTINLPAWGSEANNEGKVIEFGNMLMKYLPRLRGVTCYPDGARGGQPLTPVKYSTAIKHVGEVFVEGTDVCDITKGGSCG